MIQLDPNSGTKTKIRKTTLKIKKGREIFAINKNRRKWQLKLKELKLAHLEIMEDIIMTLQNFITKKSICGEIIILNSNDFSNNDIDGKIVLIENADPGFDWIFSHKIIGLITKFGGVASHMSIRSAEFNLPAAIGCGSTIYDYVKNSKKIEMNCATEQIKRIM